MFLFIYTPTNRLGIQTYLVPQKTGDLIEAAKILEEQKALERFMREETISRYNRLHNKAQKRGDYSDTHWPCTSAILRYTATALFQLDDRGCSGHH